MRAFAVVTAILCGCGPTLEPGPTSSGSTSSSSTFGTSSSDAPSSGAVESGSTTGDGTDTGSSDSGGTTTGGTCDETMPYLDEAACLAACDVCQQLEDGGWYCTCI